MILQKVYNDAHHEYWTRHLSENLQVNQHCRDSLYLYYNAAKAYSVEEFNDHIVENITREDNQFTVFSAGSTSTVNLLEKSCSCREYDLVKIPCAHAMVALRSKHGDEYGMSIYEYSSPLYKAETYLIAYSESINGVLIESEWCVLEELLSVHIFSPLVDNKLGRKKRKRVKGVGENFKSKRKNKCSICKISGHKRTTCMNNSKS
ncbi:hypothetical protein KY290_017073 [Solanum tuberosum]|uniref:SWIM-type domain-containing protein n=1 Tax=Solanum tuberosum TaxID=4113 RepID=A0ABQ7VA87_SOLTU|nr:hypothetical protein KY284_016139 [Solanum tuberosum]KAH0761000.1 hypothetical protein KY290_017073 [Solanum tuberosum]